MAAPLHQQLQLHGVDLRLGTSVTAVRRTATAAWRSHAQHRRDASRAAWRSWPSACGPRSTLAREAGLDDRRQRGGIVVDEHMRTSDPDIYAVGDAVEVDGLRQRRPALIPLAGPANRQGRIAADNVFGRDSVYRSTQGTAICKVFDLAIGMTGLSEKALQARRAALREGLRPPGQPRQLLPRRQPAEPQAAVRPGRRQDPRRPGGRRRRRGQAHRRAGRRHPRRA